MRIRRDEMIAGMPAFQARTILRTSMGSGLGAGAEAEDLLRALSAAGYLEKDEHGCWQNTIKGNALAMASANRPIKRPTANRLVTEFLSRVKQVNRNPHYLYRVEKVSLFGSMLSDSETLGDVDLWVEMTRKETDPDKYMELSNQRSHEAAMAGRRFSNQLDYLFWPQNEVILFLKNRSPYLNIHRPDADTLMSVLNPPRKTIFEA